MAYKHGIEVQENPTSLAAPVTGTAGLQVVFGTAPVNLAADPYKTANELIIAYTLNEAQEALGYSDDIDKYTLCQSMDASFKMFKVAPVIFCNVLDPVKHSKQVEESILNVVNGQVTVEVEGILLDTLVVKMEDDSATLVAGADYIMSFDSAGFAVITMLEGSYTKLKISGKAIDPGAVTYLDIIGGYDAITDKETGLELVRKVYPLFGIPPRTLLAPGWSHIPAVGAILEAKTREINGVFNCETVLDLDTEKAPKYMDCLDAKNEYGYIGEHSIIVWPMVSSGGKIYHYSAIYGAMMAYSDLKNGDVPHISPSNKLLEVDGTCLRDGTEIMLDQNQASALNGNGIVTAIREGIWKSWGNNMACYPGNAATKDRWICCRRFFSWWATQFILEYKEKTDGALNKRLIESIVDQENIRGNSYVSQGICAGARIEYLQDDNSLSALLDGKIQFRQYLAPYTPAEYILNKLEFDPDMLEEAIGGI